MIVIDVLRKLQLADRAKETLLGHQPIGYFGFDPVAIFGEVVPPGPVPFDPVFSRDDVVARTAVGAEPVITRSIPRELSKG
jgi:hypothetical protein